MTYPSTSHVKNSYAIFSETENVDFIRSLPLDTYRNDVLLIMQLKNSTVLAFDWDGREVKQVTLPNQVLNYLDFKTTAVIPKFGFMNRNSIIKLNYTLTWSSSSKNNKYKSMLETQAMLEVRKQ